MTTIKNKISLKGSGLHTGKECRITLSPWDREGIFFLLDGEPVRAEAENVCDTSRCTMLNLNGHIIQTCEHLLASVYGLGINSVLIEMEGEEVPIFDGSGKVWTEALKDNITGTAEKPFSISEPISVAENDAFIKAEPSDSPLEIQYNLDYAHPLIGKSSFLYTRDKFEEYIAPSRTFALFEEVEYLRAKGLAQGGSEENCIVVFGDRLSSPLRHPDEFATHKILDLIGDLSLTGKSLNIKITANKSGHRLNNLFARKLRKVIENA